MIVLTAFGSYEAAVDCLVVFLDVPVALGIAVQDAILVVSHYRNERERGSLAVIAAESAASTWLRPCLMTTMIAMIGLLPVALSTGIGAETQKPLAIVARFLQPAALLVLDRSNCADPTKRSPG